MLLICSIRFALFAANHILVAMGLGRKLSVLQISWNNFPSNPVTTLLIVLNGIQLLWPVCLADVT